MWPIVAHFAIFLLPISAAMFGLNWMVRAVARGRRIALPEMPREAVWWLFVRVAAAGAAGQLLFQLLHSPFHLGLFWGRAAAYAAAGALTALAVRRLVPYISDCRALFFGGLGGLVAETAYALLVRGHGENMARVVSELVLCAIVALAVRLPLPAKEVIPKAANPCAECEREARCKECEEARELIDGPAALPVGPPPAPSLLAPTFGPRSVYLRKMPTAVGGIRPGADSR